jgi:hypothetical protein
MKKILSAIAFMGLIGQSIPGWASAGTEGASFLDIPVGAGPAALGAAYTALATNAYAPTWNPAGLGSLSGTEVAAQHLSYLESMNYEYLSIVHPLNFQNSDTKRGIGFSMQYLGSGDINRTDIDSGGNEIDNLGTFSSHYASYNLSYGQTLSEKLSVGLTGKLINASIDDVSANAYAADLGALYRANEQVQLGASLVNMGTQLKFISEGDSLPMAFKIGGAYQPNSRYLVSAEGVYEKNGLASFHTGFQWRPIEMVSLRAGYRTDTLSGLSPLAGFSTGLGLHVWGQEFAYAWTPYGDLGDTQYFSLLIHFGAAAEEKQNLIQYQSIKQHRSVQGSDWNQKGKSHASDEATEPEYQQLMQLLSAGEDGHKTQTAGSGTDTNR